MWTTQTIYRTPKTAKFTQVSKEILENKKLSLQAKGLLVFFLSFPDTFRHSEHSIMKFCNNGRDSIRRCIHELVSLGYLVRTQPRDDLGLYEKSFWIILEDPGLKSKIPSYLLPFPHRLTKKPLPDHPMPENPSTGNPSPENPQPEKPLPENQSLYNNNHTNTDQKILSSSILAQLPPIYMKFRHYFLQYKVDEVDDVLDLDFWDFESRLSYFESDLKHIKNPRLYLEKILESVRRLSPEEIERKKEIQSKKEAAKIKTAEINAFEFSGPQEMQYYMRKYKERASQFTLFYDKPTYCPPSALFLLKKLAMEDKSFQPDVLDQ